MDSLRWGPRPCGGEGEVRRFGRDVGSRGWRILGRAVAGLAGPPSRLSGSFSGSNRPTPIFPRLSGQPGQVGLRPARPSTGRFRREPRTCPDRFAPRVNPATEPSLKIPSPQVPSASSCLADPGCNRAPSRTTFSVVGKRFTIPRQFPIESCREHSRHVKGYGTYRVTVGVPKPAFAELEWVLAQARQWRFPSR